MSRKSIVSFRNLFFTFSCRFSPLTELSENEFTSSSGFRGYSLSKCILLSLFTIILSSSVLTGQTTTFTANATGDWTTVAWIKAGPSLATYPGQPGYEVEIHHVAISGAGITVTLNTNIISSVRNVTITSGALDISSNTLTMTGNLTGAGTISFTSGTLNIAGNNTMSGTLNSGSGVVNYNGSSGQTVKGTTYHHLIISGTGTKVLQAATTINGNLNITGNSTLLTNQFQITGNATGTLSMDAGTNLLVGNPANTINVSFPTSFITSNIQLNANSTVSYQAGTSQTISAAPVYGNLTTAIAGTKSLADDIFIRGNLIIGATTTLDLSVNNYNISIGGSWINSGTFSGNQGKVIFNGTTTQSIINALTGTETCYDLEFNTAGPVLSTCDLSVINNLSIINGIILMPGKTLLLGTGATNPGTLNHSSGWIYGKFSRWAAPLQNGTDLLFPVGDNYYGRSMTLNFAEITTAGIISVDFAGLQPPATGLPLVEDIYIFNVLFPEGYWNLIKDGTFSFNGTYDLTVAPAGFTSYEVDGNTRILSRSGMDWFLNGTHVNGSPALLQRDDLTEFANNFAVAFAEICNSVLINCPGDVVVNNQPGTCGNIASWTPPAISPACVNDTVTGNFKPGDYFNVGIHQVVYYLRNGAAVKDSCKFNVIVNDNESPVVICRDVSLYLGPMGTATLNVTDIDNGSSDNCSLLLVPERSEFACADAGLVIPVLLTATDPAGNSASCTAQVTVLDTIRPVINTKTFTLILGATGSGTLFPSDVDNGTFDNCTPVTLSVFPNTFSCSDQGQKTVTFTAQDNHGNTAVSTVQITVQSSLNINSTTLSSCDLGGSFALYAADVSGGDGNYSWFWDGLDDSVDPFLTLTGSYPFIAFSNTSTGETPFFNNLMPDGIYTIRLIVTDGNSCRDTMDMIINKSGFTFNNITIRHSVACEGSTEIYSVYHDPDATYNWGVENGTIITSPVDTSSVEVQWNMGVTQGVIISTATRTDFTGARCEFTVVDTVAINPLPEPVFDNPVTEVCSDSEVTYTLTQPFSDYIWSVTGGLITGGGTGSNFVTVRWGTDASGMVTVLVESSDGCSSAVFVNVSVYNLTGGLTSLQNVTCNGNADGEVTVAAAAGTGKPPYQYSLDGNPYQASGTFTGLAPGLHSVTIRDDLSCTFNVGFTITQPSALTATVTRVDVLCYGQSTGSITAVGSGGTAPITYSLDGGPYISPGVFSNLPAGPHSLIVRDASLCTFTQNISISQVSAITGSASVTTPIPCNGGTATVTLTGGGGTSPLSYTFNGMTNATGIFSGVPAGTGYAWSITDANSCGPVTGTLNVTEPEIITGSVSVTTAILCNGGTATITMTGTGGSAPLSYTFNGVTNATGVFIGISAGTGYEWSITDVNSCSPATGTFNVSEPAIITGSASVTAPVLCNGGTATVTMTGGGGTEPLSYTFNGETNATGIFSGNSAGTGYTWSITDANSCEVVSGMLDISEPSPVTGSASVTAVITCNGGTANVTLTGNGGTPPLSYTFDGVTNATGIFSGISAGTGYAWSITDVNSCGPVTGTLDVTEPAVITGSALVTVPVTCNGGTATVTLAGGGGTAPLSYTFNGVTNATGIFSGIHAGTDYVWSITDVNSCTSATGTIDVAEPSIITGSASVTTEIVCNGGTAIVTLTGEGGTIPLSYTFNGVTNTTGIFSDVPAGAGHIWSVTDANSCEPATGILDITEPSPVTGSASVTTAIVCSGGTATVTMTGSGGTDPLSYTFNGVTNQTGIFSDIPAGTGYVWSITDSFSCGPLTGTLDVAEPPALAGTITSRINVSVIGGNDGSVTVAGSGGTPAYLYRLDAGAYQASGNFGSLTAGSYTVTVQDAVLCEAAVPVMITEPYLPLTGTATRIDILCFGESTGSITVTGAEGVPPYQYSLNSGTFQTSDTFSSLAAGPYVVTVSDAVSNLFEILDTISQPAEALSVTTEKTNVLCNGDNNGTATATAAGGTAPYDYSWNTTPVQTTAFATGLVPGTYRITVTDANGCTTSAEVTITEPLSLSVYATSTDAECPDSNDGSIILDITGGTAPYSPIWSDGNTSLNRTAMLPGTYEVVVTDANGCPISTNVEVGFVGTYGCLVIPQIITPNNDGYNDEWIIRNIEIYQNAEILIFTRWGKLIYRTKNISADPWDGRFDGKLMPTDSYHYILYLNDGSEPRSGVISVIR